MDNKQFDPAAINAATNIETLVARYVNLKRQGGEFVGPCIWHSPDDNPSMYVVPNKGFVHCFACGAHADAIGFLQQVEGIDFKEACRRLTNGGGAALPPVNVLPKRELKKPVERMTFPAPYNTIMPDMTLGKLGLPVASWPYYTADGKGTYGYIARYEGEDGKKEIRCWSWGQRSANDPVRWECGAFSKPRPLYGLNRLVENKQVLIVEGEKAADAAAHLLPNLCVVTWPGGAGAVRHANWSPLRGRSVVIWPDNDDAGKEAAEHLVTALRAVGVARVKVLTVGTVTAADGTEQAVPLGWDAADAKASAWTKEEAWEWAKKRVGPDLHAGPAPAPAEPPTGSPDEPQPPENPPSEPDTAPPAAPEAASPAPAAPAAPDHTPPPPDNVTPLKPRPRGRPAAAPGPGGSGGGGGGNAAAQPRPEDEPLSPAYSQDALALALVKKVGDDWRHTAVRSQWYRWNGSIWVPEKTLEIFEEARRVARDESDNPDVSASLRRDIASRSTAASMVVMASWDRKISVPVDAWDTHKQLLGTPKGVVDLTVGKLIEGSREQLITMSTSVAPETGTPELWLRCLNEWCGGDSSLIDYLQRLCGYCLTGETREQMLAFIHGPAKAGKGTFIKHIAEIMGDYASNAEMDTFIESKQERHSSELARLRSKRLVYAAETEEGRRWAEAKIKKLSGEDKITARNLYENPEEFSPEFKLMIYGNYAPHLRNPDDAIARRMHIVPFVHPVSAENRDYYLDEKLRPEHGRILSWMIRGALLWNDSGLGMPEIISEAVTKYMDSEDTFGDWVNEFVERRTDSREKSADLYNSYRKFIEARGELPVSQKRFSPKLEERGFRRVKSSGIRMFEGGRLRQSDDAAQAAANYQRARQGGD